jgi:hypothetical protein
MNTNPESRQARRNSWSLFSAHGRVILYIALCPDCTVDEIAQALGLSERGVRLILRDIRAADMVTIARRNRRHHYRVNLDAPLLHPTIKGFTLRPLLGRLVHEGQGRNRDECARVASGTNGRASVAP